MEKLIIELKQEEQEEIYGGGCKLVYINGEWIVVCTGTEKSLT